MNMAGETTNTVRDFYTEMPFNYWSDIKSAAESIRRNPLRTYCDLDDVLDTLDRPRVLEIGCGAGWASNSLALHYGAEVTAVDMTGAALDRARLVSQHLGVSDQVTFIESDLFDFQTAERFDIVLSVGVLHHTHDCRGAFAHAGRFVRPGGHVFVGLYHLYGRRPFLKMFDTLLAQGDGGQEAAFRRYAALHGHLDDETHLRSWFRDQVLHPQETQHSLEEVMTWLDEDGFSLLSTSINQYGDTSDRAALIETEKTLEALSEQRNVIEGSYFPGFFTILAERTKGAV